MAGADPGVVGTNLPLHARVAVGVHCELVCGQHELRDILFDFWNLPSGICTHKTFGSEDGALSSTHYYCSNRSTPNYLPILYKYTPEMME